MNPTLSASACPLCQSAGGTLLWQDDELRVIEVDMPGYLRVVWNGHIAEMSDLSAAQRARLMDVVMRTETALRDSLAPDKINLAALGNMVPHLHWHIIPRWRDDPHFPDAIWAAPHREPDPQQESARRAKLATCRKALLEALAR
ncbi:HIT family protein [Kerstersia gyiorum]|uniref:HIT family protein n=1 Tax=Kerstersia gyiorum TaxID=206506 RepID=UPI0020A1E55A|nr:HIT family protein [Kerstersia gyiorum]MCP1677869.1 diadenosine tetraphosphate (Ap4A) HIT family hydrolase [Kerstersia gyiorum]MCP1822240.1 diadenosine tetraphosphate (Ap4A) HIT family hydrolase [Kerstersia gyiorum]MCP1825664.1 diadenosine tetraphosphate (Ap4A) HIT family hydrolase [Kerstersia gyiorum]MCW2449540.1 diadenosine tetraphosphate (Ap4A) HIT family hydrolase [Kerstersia gyiorum]